VRPLRARGIAIVGCDGWRDGRDAGDVRRAVTPQGSAILANQLFDG
jgi:hypothetical protein